MRHPSLIHDKIKYVRIAKSAGLLEQKGAKTELARILGVSKQYLGYLLKTIEAEGSAASIIQEAHEDGS